MTIQADKLKIAGTEFDKRSKLSKDQRDAIKLLYMEGKYSQRRLAAMFNVSKGSIQSIVAPWVRKKPKKKSPEYWSELKRRCREHKRELLQSGQLKINKNYEVKKNKKA